jgi:hypothetical protein
MGGTSKWDVSCDEGDSEILAQSQEFGNRPNMTANNPDNCGRHRTSMESADYLSNSSER